MEETERDNFGNLSERVEAHMQGMSLPMHDINGLMRHILDSLGALRVRLEQDGETTSETLKTFSESCKILLDDINGFDPIDNESGLKFLMSAFPDPRKKRDGRSWLPLHWSAAIHSTEPEVLRELIGDLPIQLTKGHLHCETKTLSSSSSVVSTDGAGGKQTPDYMGLLPLHLACSLRHPNLQNIHLLVKKGPEALRMPDHRGWLPLHWCAYNNRHSEVMQFLIQSYPDACYEVNKKGKLPFQLAAYNRYTIMMDLLLAENAEAIHGLDYNGNTPLHDAAKSLNYEGCKKLLAMKPEMNRVRNFKEDLPIHKVFSFIPRESSRLYHRQFETIKAILNFNPEVAALPDRNSSLPLHLAVFFQCTFEVVQYIHAVYPSATLVRDNQGNLPVHYANSANTEVKQLLLQSSPQLAKAGMTMTFSRFASS
eukprot:gene2994-2194_t